MLISTSHKFEGWTWAALSSASWWVESDCDFLTVTWGSRVVFFRCRVLHQWIRSAGWAVLQAHCGSSGIGAVGVEDGNPGLTVAELLNYSCPLTLPASIPLCSASTETSITVWMNDLRLSPSLNLKWGALCWLLWKQLQRYSHRNFQKYYTCWDWT